MGRDPPSSCKQPGRKPAARRGSGARATSGPRGRARPRPSSGRGAPCVCDVASSVWCDRPSGVASTIKGAGQMPTSRMPGCSRFTRPGKPRDSLDEETTDWRAVCGKPPVRFAGRGRRKPIPTPIPRLIMELGFHCSDREEPSRVCLALRILRAEWPCRSAVQVESRMGAVAWGLWPAPRFPSPLMEPDVR